MTKDVFAKVPEFLAAFDNIVRNGFFGSITLNVFGSEGVVLQCVIAATGYVPNDKKHAADGCGAIVDPDAIIASCRKLAAERGVKDVSVQIKTDAWSLWDDQGVNIIGSKGTCTKIDFGITFGTRE